MSRAPAQKKREGPFTPARTHSSLIAKLSKNRLL